MTTTRKKVKALRTGAEYGVATAGGASMLLNILGLCVTISNPILLAIAGVVGAIFCCYGGCQELNQKEENNIEEENHSELLKIEQKLENLEEKVAGRLIDSPAIFSRNRDFIRHGDIANLTLFDGPMDMVMDEKKETIKRSASAKF